MAEEGDVRIARLEKASQDQQGQMVEMMEMLRTLVRDKAQAIGPSPQNSATLPEQKRKDLAYPHGFITPYAQA